MSIDVLKRAGLFIAYVLVQAMVLGRIHLFGFATPLLYVYFVVKFPRNYPKWGILYGVSRLDWLSTSSATLPGWQQEL